MGDTTMLGLLKAARLKGIKAVGLKTDIRGLKKLIKKDYKIISYFSKNYHYVVVHKISKDRVYIFDPAMREEEWEMPLSIFKKDWSGEVLVLGKNEYSFARYSHLTKGRMQEIKGGNGCANSNGDSGNNGGDTSSDPVILSNGNLMTTTNDILIPGKIPLEITRTYNAQVISDVEKWTPTSSWVIEDGEYRGQGDYSIYDGVLGDLTVELDMKTIEPGGSYMWEVCSVSFRYRDRNNRYYFTIHTTGKIELAKFVNGQQYSDLASKQTNYSTLEWNHINIIAIDANIQVYINNALELEYIDPNPLLVGQVMIESYYSYGAFDNISISDGSSIVYENDFSDNADEWDSNPPDSWYITDGEYASDSLMATNKAYSEELYGNLTLELDMRTQQSYGNPWEVAWINIRRADDNNLYYFNIQTNGKVELIKKKNGVTTPLSTLYNTGYNPLNWNKIKIIAIENRFQIYIDRRKIIDVTDNNPVDTGYIVLEAFRSNVRFDNITIRNGAEPYQNDFTGDDSNGIFGRNITFNYGMRAVEKPNGDVTVITEGGRKLIFEPDIASPGTYKSPRGIYNTLTKDINGYYLITKHGLIYTFDIDGKLLTIADSNNNQITIGYNLSQPATITDTYGRQLQITYNGDGKISKITDSIGREINYAYDINDCLSSVTDPMGNSVTYIYNPNYNLASYTDAEDNIYQYTYYYNDKVYQQTDPEGNITTFDYLWDKTVVTNARGDVFYYEFYEENDKFKSKTDFMGYEDNYTYDNQDNITRYTDKNGNTTTYTYDIHGNTISNTNPLGEVQTYGYDPTYNQMTSYIDANDNTYTYEYNPNGNLTKIIDPIGNETNMTYDNKGNLLTITNALGHTTSYTYDINGYLSTVTDPLGNITTNTYNTIGQLINKEDANGSITNFEYDANGNITKVTDVIGNETIYTYDGNDRKISETQYDNNREPFTTLYEYDWAGNITQIIDPGDRRKTSTYDLTNYMHLSMALLTSSSNSCGGCPGETTHYEYDKDGRLIKTTDAIGNIIQYNYNIAQDLAQITDANGNVTSYIYNENHQLIETIYPDGGTKTITYGNNGELVSTTDHKGQIIIFEYDELGRQTKKRYPDASEINYTYDVIGRITTVADSNGTITYSYNNAGLLIQITYPDGKTISYAYDPAGNLTQVTYPDGTAINYILNRLNRIIQIQHSGLGIIDQYIYDSLGRRVTKTLNNNTYTTYTYDDSNNLLSLINKKNDNTIISSYGYTYDSNNYNRTSMTTQGGTYNYTYDPAYQLIGVAYPDGKAISYGYDSMGNRLDEDNDGVTINSTHNNLNQITQSIYNNGNLGNRVTVRGNVMDTNISSVTVNGIPAQVNNNLFMVNNVPLAEGDNTITAVATDLAGNTQEDIISVTLNPIINVNYNYDANGNMITKTEDGETTTYQYDYDNRLIQVTKSDGAVISYKYDIFGRRIEKNVNGTVTKYIYNGSQIIQELDNAGTIKAAYVYGLGVDEPLLMQRNNNTYYYYFDGLGSVTDLTNNSGDIIEKYKYDPFGKTTILDPAAGTVRNSSSINNYYMYTGRQIDEETGLYYYRNRYYDTGTGKFITADPIGYKGGLNLYTYCKNNPINLTDPSGTIVRLCDVEGWMPAFSHTFVEIYGLMGYVGSWGFYPRNYENKDVRDRVKNFEVVHGFVRRHDAWYTYFERGKKYKCKSKNNDDSKDWCVKIFAEIEADRTDIWFQLGGKDCKWWADGVLKKCGVRREKEKTENCPWWWPPCWFRSVSPSGGGTNMNDINSSK